MSTTLRHRNLPQLMLQAREALMAQFRPILNENGVTEQQWRIIRALLTHGPLEPRQLCELCQISSPSIVGVLEPWCDRLAKDSAGQLKCQIYPAMQLGGTPPQLADQVKNAVADIVMTSPSYSSGRFPYTEALEQPFTLPPGGLAGSKAMWEYSQKYATKDYADFKLLAMFTGSGIIMSTSSKPILTVEGFKGVKLRSPSRSAAKLLTALEIGRASCRERV